MADATTPPADDSTKTPPAPTEEEVKAANKAEDAKWQGDFKEEDLTVPYSRDEEEDDDTNGDKGAGSADDKSDKSKVDEGGKSKDDGSVEGEPEDEDERFEEPAPVVTIADPGEYKAPDVSFKVEIKDGDKSKTVTIKTPEDAERIAENPDYFENPKQLMDFINKQSKMNNALDRSKEKYDDQKAKFDEQSEVETERQGYVDHIEKEIAYLIGKKELPAIPADLKEADWDDPEVAKREEIKLHRLLISRIQKERDTRVKAGLSPFVSALDVWKDIKNEKKAKDTETKAAGDSRKAAGARVAGVSASDQTPYVPKGIAVGNPNVFKRGQAAWDN